MGDKSKPSILLYCRINSQDPVNKGAVKKYRGWLNAAQTLGLKTDIVWLRQDGLVLGDTLLFPFRIHPSMESLRNIFFNHVLLDWAIARKVDFTAYDVFFVRFPLCHPAFFYLLRKAKKTKPDLKVFLEVPTFPYCLEHTAFVRKIQYGMDCLLQPLLRHYVDKTVHYGDFPSLFGIPSIAIGNGVDVSAFPVSETTSQKGLLRLLAVGNWNHWHGLDRLFRGLFDYVQNVENDIKIELTIVGGGRELSNYQALTESFHLGEFVKYLPPMEGPALDALFDQADLAIGCLGIHRKKVALDSSLKHREYASRGIPFILSTLDPDFPPSLPWVFYVSKDENPVNIHDLATFFTSTIGRKDLKLMMRQYALEKLDWPVKLKQVFLVGG